jgi:hypothetical protein
MASCEFPNPPICWDEVVDSVREKICGKILQSFLGRLCVGAVIYHLWRHRNDLLRDIPFDLKNLFWCKSCGKFVAECWLRDGLEIVQRRKSCVKMEFAYLDVISACCSCCRWMEVLL